MYRHTRRVRTYAASPLTHAFFVFSVNGIDLYADRMSNLHLVRAWDMECAPNLI